MREVCLQFASDWSTTSSGVTISLCAGTAHTRPVPGLVPLTFSHCLGLRSIFSSRFSPCLLDPSWPPGSHFSSPALSFPVGSNPLRMTTTCSQLLPLSQALELSICHAWPSHTHRVSLGPPSGPSHSVPQRPCSLAASFPSCHSLPNPGPLPYLPRLLQLLPILL